MAITWDPECRRGVDVVLYIGGFSSRSNGSEGFDSSGSSNNTTRVSYNLIYSSTSRCVPSAECCQFHWLLSLIFPHGSVEAWMWEYNSSISISASSLQTWYPWFTPLLRFEAVFYLARQARTRTDRQKQTWYGFLSPLWGAAGKRETCRTF